MSNASDFVIENGVLKICSLCPKGRVYAGFLRRKVYV